MKTSRLSDCDLGRKRWGSGPWDNEPDRVEWARSGRPCILLRQHISGHWCGYVAVDPGHPCHGKGCDDRAMADLVVHGSITYARGCAGHVCHVAKPGEPDDVWWLGFDCAHYGDFSPGRSRFGWQMPHGLHRYKTLAYAKSETERLADQLIGMVAT